MPSGDEALGMMTRSEAVYFWLKAEQKPVSNVIKKLDAWYKKCLGYEDSYAERHFYLYVNYIFINLKSRESNLLYSSSSAYILYFYF